VVVAAAFFRPRPPRVPRRRLAGAAPFASGGACSSGDVAREDGAGSGAPSGAAAASAVRRAGAALVLVTEGLVAAGPAALRVGVALAGGGAGWLALGAVGAAAAPSVLLRVSRRGAARVLPKNRTIYAPANSSTLQRAATCCATSRNA